MRSSFTEVETGREALELEAWQVRMVCRCFLLRLGMVRVLVTLASSLSKEVSTTWLSLHQVTEGEGLPPRAEQETTKVWPSLKGPNLRPTSLPRLSRITGFSGGMFTARSTLDMVVGWILKSTLHRYTPLSLGLTLSTTRTPGLWSILKKPRSCRAASSDQCLAFDRVRSAKMIC